MDRRKPIIIIYYALSSRCTGPKLLGVFCGGAGSPPDVLRSKRNNPFCRRGSHILSRRPHYMADGAIKRRRSRGGGVRRDWRVALLSPPFSKGGYRGIFTSFSAEAGIPGVAPAKAGNHYGLMRFFLPFYGHCFRLTTLVAVRYISTR